MTLPKWIKYEIASLRSEDHCDEVDLDRLFKALEIAWEALETIVANPVAACSDRHDVVAQDAMRRIEEMGK